MREKSEGRKINKHLFFCELFSHRQVSAFPRQQRLVALFSFLFSAPSTFHLSSNFNFEVRSVCEGAFGNCGRCIDVAVFASCAALSLSCLL